MSESSPAGEPDSGNADSDKDFSAFTKWMAGFFDGEGTIKSHVRESPTHSIGYGINPQVSLSHQYVGGLFDAEGCVKAGPIKVDHVSIGYGAFPQAVISNQDETIMAMLREWAESNGIDCKFYRNSKGDYDDTFTFQVQRLDDVETFLEVLYPHLVIKRKQANIMLEDIIPLVQNGAHLKKMGFLEVMHHIDRLNEGKGGNRGKYNLEYFEDLWGMERNDKDWF